MTERPVHPTNDELAPKERQPSDHPHLLMQRVREQVLRDHRIYAAHDVDDLGHPQGDGDAAQRIGIERRQFGCAEERNCISSRRGSLPC